MTEETYKGEKVFVKHVPLSIVCTGCMTELGTIMGEITQGEDDLMIRCAYCGQESHKIIAVGTIITQKREKRSFFEGCNFK